MKIIKEIEKSRLNEITGGVGENCSIDVTYRSCGSSGGLNFEVTVCAIKLSCPAAYYCCSGPSTNQYQGCKTTSGTNHVTEY